MGASQEFVPDTQHSASPPLPCLVAGPVGVVAALGLHALGVDAIVAGVAAGGLSVGLTLLARRRVIKRDERSGATAELNRLRALVEDIDVVTWEFEPGDRRFTYVAPQAARFGYSAEQWLEPGFFASILHEEDRERVVTSCAASTEKGEDHELVYRMILADGSIVWIRDLVRVVQRPGREPLLRGVFVDITEQRETEMELDRVSNAARIESEHLGLAVAGGHIGTFDWNPSTDELEVNDTWVELTGLERDRLTGTTADWSGSVFEEDLETALEAVDKHFRGETEVYESTVRRRRLDGSTVWIQSRGKVVAWDEEWNPVRMVGIILDRTDEVTHGIESEKLRLEAERSNQAKSEFLANMSHEIRTPLTAILGYAELFASGAESIEDTEKVAQMLETIQQAGDHLLSLINDILDLSKIEADKIELEALDVHLGAELLRVVELIRPRVEGKGVSFEVELAGPIPSHVRIDATRLRQVLVNLLGNAAKFTEEGRVLLRIDAKDDTLSFEIEDTGSGMTETQAEALFRPFNQGDSSVTRRFGGTGLGLTISRRLARLMGGDVDLARTIAGVGSVFSARFPLVRTDRAVDLDVLEGEPEKKEAAAEQAESRLDDVRILLVEDGPVNQRLIASILRKAGAEVTVASDGLEALDCIDDASEPFTIVLSDMQMPRMDGYTLAARLRDEGFPSPIIALTAHAMAEDRARCLAAGCDDFATKPIDRPALLATCANWAKDPGRKAA